MGQSLTNKQKEMIAYGLAHPYSILAADPRLGKTRAAIILQQKRNANCLVVCPAYLIPNWKKEIKKWSPKSSVTMFRKGKEIYDVCDSDFVVISYDLAQKAEHLFEWADMVVADEIHNLKSMSAKRTQFFHKAIFENTIKFFHGLTGTPLKNRVREFYSIIALTYYDPRMDEGFKPEFTDFWGDFKNFVHFKAQRQFLDIYPDEITFAEKFSMSETYDTKVVGKRGKVFSIPITRYFGLKNKDELKIWLKGKYLRIRADKNDLPPISYLDILVSDIDNSALLNSFKKFFVSDAAIRGYVDSMKAKNVKVKERDIRKMRTSTTLPEHKLNAAVQKVPFTIQYIEDLMGARDCCLVYSDHKEPIQKIAAHFNVPAITGEMPSARRAKLVDDFQAGKLNILCATVGSLKEGADLFRARDVVLNDPPWVPGDIQQVINRTRALGEKDPRTVHRILGSPQDAAIWEALEDKMKTIDEAT